MGKAIQPPARRGDLRDLYERMRAYEVESFFPFGADAT
jgi:hypothetical protein